MTNINIKKIQNLLHRLILRFSNPLPSPRNNGGFSNDYMADGVFDTDSLMGQSVSTKWSLHGTQHFDDAKKTYLFLKRFLVMSSLFFL